MTPRATHPLIETAARIWGGRKLDERVAVWRQRQSMVRWFQIARDKLVADPTATEEDLETVTRLLGWANEEVDKDEIRLERRRAKTRERVRRFRARAKT